MRTVFVLCFFLVVAVGQQESETSEGLSANGARLDGGADKVKSKEAAGREGRFGGDQYLDSSICSMEASYVLALNGDRYLCRDTATDYDSCVACCVSATRSGAKINRKDVSGFLASNIVGNGRVCVCCIPNVFDERQQ